MHTTGSWITKKVFCNTICNSQKTGIWQVGQEKIAEEGILALRFKGQVVISQVGKLEKNVSGIGISICKVRMKDF